MENRECQNCHNNFTIEPDDFGFYEKIGVPVPTFCRICMNQRRLSFRNTHSLYKRKDSFTGKDIITIYSPDKDLTVMAQKDWWGDSWNAMDYAQDYDFSKPFFTQWDNLRNNVPMQSLSNSKAVNSDYCNVAEESYDCYLVSASWRCERSMYCDAVSQIKDTMDCHVVNKSDFCYDDVLCQSSYKLFYSQDCHACTDSYFLYDCSGCTDCFMSSNLRNKSYCFNNVQLTKEAYKEKMSQINLGSFETVQYLKSEFEKMRLNSFHRFSNTLNSVNVTGNNIENAKNCYYAFDAFEGLEDSKYVFWAGYKGKEFFHSGPGVGEGELMYECTDCGIGGNRNLFANVTYGCQNIEYCINCHNSSNLFGCIGLRSKQYCIFNKQYTKEEWLELIPKIKQHMNDMPYIDKAGVVYKYGEFFPIELSHFCYNETVAMDYYPLTKEECLARGYKWKDPEIKNYVPTVKSTDLPDDIAMVGDNILGDIIECAHKGECSDRCSTAFKITENELNFYKRFNIPLPRLCNGCRHYERLHKRTPMDLWHRQCMCNKSNHNHSSQCPVEFETAYAPDRPEIVYCEKCYQQEVI